MFKTAIYSLLLSLSVCILLIACLDKTHDSDETVQVICSLNLTRNMIKQLAINTIRLSIVNQNGKTIWGPQDFNLHENEHGATMTEVAPGNNYLVYAQALQANGVRVCLGYSIFFNAVSGQQADAGTIDLSCVGDLYDSGQDFGNSFSYDVSLGDLDGDGDLDAFVADGYDNTQDQTNKVWFNDGQGIFSDSGQRLGNIHSRGVAMGDVDLDGDLDAITGEYGENGAPNKIWLNDGSGNFSDSGQNLSNGQTTSILLTDLDGDSDLDAFVGNALQPDKVWLNDGNGNFNDSGQNLGITNTNSMRVASGDLDGDGDQDVMVAGYYVVKVWLNDGSANFTEQQTISTYGTQGVSLGDVDGDSDLDAFFVNFVDANGDPAPNQVFLNDGNGQFTNSGQSLGNVRSFDASLCDFDQDGDLDAFVGNDNDSNRVWLNDGNGSFTDSGMQLAGSLSISIAPGDIDNDGDIDVFVANYGTPNKVFLNRF
ncbi:FG-GAP repeat domain-containing protein [candidate division CSSED10-310 bacterium]|uniref:FG-GAP repeat domain-containing protein n=1 Tax=candidate division CSSED10-310 bacterium TaxID=2855610 RepID=A0ABV6Z585_UNCC1